MIDEPVVPVVLDEPVDLGGVEEPGARFRSGGPPEVMFGHFFVAAAFDELELGELEDLFDVLLEVDELVFVEEVLIPDEEPDFGSV